jgi:kynurenine formamidase
MLCEGRGPPPPLLDPDEVPSSLCDPKDPANCVEFCSRLAPECATWIHDHDIAMLGSDGVSDPLPNNDNGWPIPIHMCCLVAMGVPLLDNLDLSRLAAACAAEQRWEFLLTVAALQVHGGTGSPINPIAII